MTKKKPGRRVPLEVLKINIETDTQVSGRTRAVLHALGVVTVADLIRVSEAELKAAPDYKPAVLADIQKLFDLIKARHGVELTLAASSKQPKASKSSKTTSSGPVNRQRQVLESIVNCYPIILTYGLGKNLTKAEEGALKQKLVGLDPAQLFVNSTGNLNWNLLNPMGRMVSWLRETKATNFGGTYNLCFVVASMLRDLYETLSLLSDDLQLPKSVIDKINDAAQDVVDHEWSGLIAVKRGDVMWRALCEGTPLQAVHSRFQLFNEVGKKIQELAAIQVAFTGASNTTTAAGRESFASLMVKAGKKEGEDVFSKAKDSANKAEKALVDYINATKKELESVKAAWKTAYDADKTTADVARQMGFLKTTGISQADSFLTVMLFKEAKEKSAKVVKTITKSILRSVKERAPEITGGSLAAIGIVVLIGLTIFITIYILSTDVLPGKPQPVIAAESLTEAVAQVSTLSSFLIFLGTAALAIVNLLIKGAKISFIAGIAYSHIQTAWEAARALFGLSFKALFTTIA